MKKLANTLLILTAFAPILVYGGFVSPFVDAKVLFLRGVSFSVILLIALIFVSKSGHKGLEAQNLATRLDVIRKDRLFITISASIALMAISTIFAFDPSMAFFGEPLRGEGFLTVFTIYSLYVGFLLLFNKKDWNTFFICTIVTTIVLFIIQVKQSALGMYRSDSLLGNPIFLASYYLFSIFASFATIRFGKSIKNSAYVFWGSFGIIISGIGILLTKTRGTMLAVFVGLFAMALVAIFYGKNTYVKKTSVQKIGLFVIIFMIAFSGVFMATRRAAFWQHVPGLNRVALIGISDNSASSRLEYTKISIQGFFKDQKTSQTLIGWGQGNYQFFWVKNYTPIFFYYDPETADHAHNQLVDILVMSGILGLLVYICIWFFYIKKIGQFVKKDLILGLGVVFWATAYFINNLFAFDTIETLLTFYFMTSFITSLIQNNYEKQA